MDATNTAPVAAPSAHVLAYTLRWVEKAADYTRAGLRECRDSWGYERSIRDLRSLEELAELIEAAIEGRRYIDDVFQFADSYCRNTELNKDDIDLLEDLAVEEDVALDVPASHDWNGLRDGILGSIATIAESWAEVAS